MTTINRSACHLMAALALLAWTTASVAIADNKYTDDHEPIIKEHAELHSKFSGSEYKTYDGIHGRIVDAIKQYNQARQEALKKLTERIEADKASDDGKDGWESVCERATNALEKAKKITDQMWQGSRVAVFVNGEAEQWKVIVEKGGEYQEFLDDLLTKAEEVEKDSERLESEGEKYTQYAENVDSAFDSTMRGLAAGASADWCDRQISRLNSVRGACAMIDRTVKEKIEALEEFMEEHDADELSDKWGKLQGVKFDPDDRGLYRDTTRRWKQTIYLVMAEYEGAYEDFTDEIAEPFIKGKWKEDCIVVDDLEPGRFDSLRQSLKSDLRIEVHLQDERADWMRGIWSRLKAAQRTLSDADGNHPPLVRLLRDLDNMLDRLDLATDHGSWTQATREIESKLSELERKVDDLD